MAVEKKQFNLSGPSKKEEREAARKKEAAKATSLKAAAKVAAGEDDDDEDEEDDDDMLSSVGRGKSNNNLLFAVAGVLVVVVVIVAFLLFRGGKSKEPPPPDNTVNPDVGQSDVQTPVQGNQSGGGTDTPTVGNGNQQSTIGTQDFTGNTNWTNDDVLTNPDAFVQDIYGLTTRVDYTVSKINSVADFVSYTKHRGTWGGGLELYWLDVDYRGNQYVIQVPFQYYKELDDTGIVPVKMEVLEIQGSTNEEVLNVVSYMCLDEGTLKAVLKSQGAK